MLTTSDLVDAADNKRVEEDKERAKHLGVLQVEVWRAKSGHRYQQQAQHSSHGLYYGSIPPVAEKALKGKEISHGAR